VAVLASQPRVAIVSAEHPAANKSSLPLGGLASETFLLPVNAPTSWIEEWTEPYQRPGSSCRRRECSDFEEALNLVAAGLGVMTAPASVLESYPRPDLRFVPWEHPSPASTMVASRVDNRSPGVCTFLEVVRDRIT